MSEPSARLIHEFTCHMVINASRELGVGPHGQRQLHEMESGVIEGSRLKGRLLGPGSDWMLVGADSFLRMDVRIQIETDDGATLCAHYFGLAEANWKLTQAFAASTPTEFSDQLIRSHWLLEAGDPRYAWVNQAVFVAEGRLCPASPGVMGFEHRVYRVG